MHLIRFMQPHIVIALTDTFNIIRIWRVRSTFRTVPCMILGHGIISKPYGESSFEDGYYLADGLACLRLLGWLIDQRQYKNGRALKDAFDRLFYDNPTDTLKSILRIFTGEWLTASGEEACFSLNQFWRHPREMHALAQLGVLFRSD